MILCATPNAAIDRTLIVPGFRPGEVSRAVRAIVVAGGKGLNAARAIRRLGGDPLCAGFLAGHTGRLFAELAEREGLRGVWTWIEGETRACIVLVDPDRREATLVNEPGPDVSAQDWSRFEADVLREAASAECVCLSGSLPPGSPPEAFARLTWPPALQTLSPIGSGDTFLGGLVLALTSGAPPAEALRQAVAAGAANALSVGGGHWELSNFKTVLAASVVAPISV